MRTIRVLSLHHTASRFGDVESIRALHKRRGYSDIGYSYLIGSGNGLPDGHIAMGRPENKTPAAVFKANTGLLAVALVGDFTQHPPTRRQLSALGHWLWVKGRQYKVPAARVLGHRESAIPGHGTLCPGNLDLPAIRRWYAEAVAEEDEDDVERLDLFLDRQ